MRWQEQAIRRAAERDAAAAAAAAAAGGFGDTLADAFDEISEAFAKALDSDDTDSARESDAAGDSFKKLFMANISAHEEASSSAAQDAGAQESESDKSSGESSGGDSFTKFWAQREANGPADGAAEDANATPSPATDSFGSGADPVAGDSFNKMWMSRNKSHDSLSGLTREAGGSPREAGGTVLGLSALTRDCLGEVTAGSVLGRSGLSREAGGSAHGLSVLTAVEDVAAEEQVAARRAEEMKEEAARREKAQAPEARRLERSPELRPRASSNGPGSPPGLESELSERRRSSRHGSLGAQRPLEMRQVELTEGRKPPGAGQMGPGTGGCTIS